MSACECGCGRQTAIATRNDTPKGAVKGQPRRFVHGHRPRRLDRTFWPRVSPEPTGCWFWTGQTITNGYGVTASGRRGARRLAHRLAYELLIGPIPSGLDLDHLCRIRLCVNPTHLEPVTRRENLRRGMGGTHTHCRRGHDVSVSGIYEYTDHQGARYRFCRACRAINMDKRRGL